MKKSFYSILTICVVFLAGFGIANSAAKKVVLLEQFTGAWCGYCVDGTVRMDEIIEENPGRVIGVKFHDGDAMEIPATGNIGQALGLTGYPTGNVDRTPFNVGGQTMIMLDRGAWKSAVSNVLNTAPIADLKLQWSFDPATNKITASISAVFEQAVSEELRFNVYVAEDDVVGSGTGWDQSNYYNGTSGHPYYGLGNPVKNYHHMKVVRACLGGEWGQANSIPSPVISGSNAKYTFELNKPANWKLENLKLIGLVQYYTSNNRKIMNAVMGSKVTSNTAVTSTGDELFVLPKGEAGELTINIKNNGTSTKEYTLNLIKAQGSTWSASIEPNEYVVNVPAAQTYTLKLKMNVSNTGSGEVTLNIDEADGMSFSRTLKGYSDDLSMFHVNYDPANDASGMGNIIKSYPEYAGLQTISPSDFTKIYSKFSNAKLVIYNTGDGGVLPSTENSVIQSLINKKVNFLFTGPLLYKSFNDNLQQISGQLGFAWNGMSTQGQNTSGLFNLDGVTADPVSNGFTSQIQIYYFLHKARVTDPSVASKIITLTGNTDSVFAIKSQLPNSRAVTFGFHPMSLKNTTARNTLIYNALKWVFTTLPAEIPEITTPSGMSFDECAIDANIEKKLTISNSGKKDLVISNIEIKNNTDNAYSILDYGKSTIAPGASTDVTIRFAPTRQIFYSSATIEISSNDPNKAKAVVTLSGKGGKPGSVEELANVNLVLGPNPIQTIGNIRFTIPDFAKNTNLAIIDINGKTILNLGKNYSIGENTVSFDARVLSSGNYILSLEIDGELVNTKFTINK